MQDMFSRLTAEYLQGLSQPSSSSSPRKRKKRKKKKKLPKSCLLPRSCSTSTRSSSSWRNCSSSSLLSQDLTFFTATVTSTFGCTVLASVSFFLGSDMCLSGFAGDDTFCAVFSSVVHRLKMLGIMAGIDQKGSYAARFSRAVVCTSLVLLVFSLCYFLLSPGPDARHHGRHDTEAAHQRGHQHPVVAQRLFPMVQTFVRTIEIPQLLQDRVVNALMMQVVQVPGSLLPCRGAEASPWSRLFCGPLRFLFARRQAGRCSSMLSSSLS